MININSVKDFSKLKAFLNVKSKGDFEFPYELAEEIIKYLAQFAKDNNISLELVDPSDERIVAFTAGGAMAGAAIGALIAQFPGAIIGSVVGGVIGYHAAHYKIRIDLSKPGAPSHLTLY